MSQTLKAFGTGVRVRATLQALIEAGFSVKAKGGKRKVDDNCGSEDCFYGELKETPTLSLKTEVAAGGCTIIANDASCGKLEAEPVGVTGKLEGSVRTKSTREQCADGLTGDLTLDSVTANGSFSFGSYNFGYEWKFLPEVGDVKLSAGQGQGDIEK